MNNTFTYASLVRTILELATEHDGVNTALDQDLYEINSIPDLQYPLFVCIPTQPSVEHGNYLEIRLTMYYIDRLQEGNNQQGSAETSLVYSAGINILGSIIRKARYIPGVIDIPDGWEYTMFGDTEVFADKCAGVYTNVRVFIPKTEVC